MAELNLSSFNLSTLDTSRSEPNQDSGFEEVRSQSTLKKDEYVGLVFDSDYQHHLVDKVIPIQSATFDQRISVSIRPQALDMAAPILQRESQEKITRDFSDYQRYQLGDILDASNLAEWVLFLVSSLDTQVLEELFHLDESSYAWSSEQWQDYFNSLDAKTWTEYLGLVEKHYQETGVRVLPSAEGNHDGAAWGNGVNHSRPLPVLEVQVFRYTMQRDFLEGRITRLEKKVLEKDISDEKHLALEAKIRRLKEELGEIDSRLAQSEEGQNGAKIESYSRERRVLQREIEHLGAAAKSTQVSQARKKQIEEKIERLNRRLSYIEQKLSETTSERDRVRERAGHRDKNRGKIQLPRFVIDAFLGLSRQNSLNDPSGNWAQNSGGVENNFDKEDYLYRYLSLRYPELNLQTPSYSLSETGESQTLLPLAVKIIRHPLYPDQDKNDYAVLSALSDPQTGQYHKGEGGDYMMERSMAAFLDVDTPQMVEENYDNLWKQVRPGEFLSLIECDTTAEASPNQQYLMVQAFALGEVNGKKVFHLILDGMDYTDHETDLAFFASMSKLQRQVCQVFLEKMRMDYGGEVLFVHSDHYALSMNDKDYWKEFGWQDYFAQNDIAPFLFCGHGHERKVIDETKPTLFGKPVFFGTRSVKREEGFWSIMTPSVTDSPNEFMSAKIEYDEKSGRYLLVQEYHEIVSEADKSEFSDEVESEVSNLSTYYEHNHYHKYSKLKLGFLAGLQNIFFSQDRILAYDSIPVSLGQFREALIYGQSYLKLLRDEFGEEDRFVILVDQCLKAMETHLDLWLNGNPDSDNEYDQMGYQSAVDEAQRLHNSQDKLALLSHYNDIFDCAAYGRLRILIAETPADSKAYEFWLLLAKRAADEEVRPDSKQQERKQQKHKVEEENRFYFRVDP